jgi:hypothetical protein
MVRRLDPNNLKAIEKEAIYAYNKHLWMDSINLLTKLIKKVKTSGIRAEYHFLRARVNTMLLRWEDALSVII